MTFQKNKWLLLCDYWQYMSDVWDLEKFVIRGLCQSPERKQMARLTWVIWDFNKGTVFYKGVGRVWETTGEDTVLGQGRGRGGDSSSRWELWEGCFLGAMATKEGLNQSWWLRSRVLGSLFHKWCWSNRTIGGKRMNLTIYININSSALWACM